MTGIVVIGASVLTSPALAQDWAGLQNKMIEITYVPPRNPANIPTYVIFKNQQVLEELSAFLSPLRLPRKLSIKMAECGVVNLFYDPNEGVILCYEFPRAVWRFASQIRAPGGFSRRDIVVGTFVLSTLHEIGHAVFDLLQVPVFGRQEDAADQIAAFIILNFGPDFAQKHINGAARYFRSMDIRLSHTAYSDEHGTPAQRFYNMLCIAYGAQPQTFKNVIDSGILPKERAAHCGQEYEQVKFAFASTIWPHVDQDLSKKVQSIKWAAWEGEVEKASDLYGFKFFTGTVIAWVLLVVFLTAKMSSSMRELIRQMTTFGLACFRGRLDRIHWWAYMLSASLVAYVLAYALGFFQVDFTSPLSLRIAHAVLAWSIWGLFYYWYTAFAIRRLHDRNKRNWLVVFWLAPWVFLTIIYAFPDAAGTASLVWSNAISFFLWLWILIELGFRRGTLGENRYGSQMRYGVVQSKAKRSRSSGQISVVQPATPVHGLSVAWLVAGPVILIFATIAAIMLLTVLLGS
jgi:uncharacterized membrane protein YhaH (DUF805 family)